MPSSADVLSGPSSERAPPVPKKAATVSIVFSHCVLWQRRYALLVWIPSSSTHVFTSTPFEFIWAASIFNPPTLQCTTYDTLEGH